MLLAASAISGSALDRGLDRTDRLVDYAGKVAAVFTDCFGHAAGELRTQTTGVAVGHLDQALLGVAHHKPPTQGTGRDRPPKADEHVERMLHVLELE